MSKIKKPQWDKQIRENLSAGSYSPTTTIPPYDHIDIGMKAYAEHRSDVVVIKITKIVNKCDAEGVIVNITPKATGDPKTDLSVGDCVFIARSDMRPLSQ